VREPVRVAEERLGQAITHDHCAGRNVAGRHALGARDDVRLVAVPLGAEVFTEPAERADHLVRDEQDVVLVADFPDPLEVSRRRREAASGVLDRLEKNARDGFRALELNGLGDPVGGPASERFFVGAVRAGGAGWRPVEIRVGHAQGRRDQWLEVGLDARQPRDRQSAHRRAVVGDVAGDGGSSPCSAA